MITHERALETAGLYVLTDRPGCRVKELWEDDEDYLVVVEKDGPIRVGEAFIFVKKATGRLWLAAPGAGFEKVFQMKPTSPPSSA